MYFILELNPNEFGSIKFNFKKLLDKFSKALDLKTQIRYTRNEFIKKGASLFAPKPLLIIIKSNHNNKNTTIEVLNFFHEIFRQDFESFNSKFVFLVLDDLTLYFHDLRMRNDWSFWDYFKAKKRLFQVTDKDELTNNLKENSAFKNFNNKYSDIIIKLTGGHHGLICKALQFWTQNYKKRNLKKWQVDCRVHLLQTNIIALIKKILRTKNIEYLNSALEFKEKKYSDIHLTNVIEELYINGIILKENELESVLCPGIITEVIEKIYSEKLNDSIKQKRIKSLPRNKNNFSDSIDTPLNYDIYFSYSTHAAGDLVDNLYEELKIVSNIKPIKDKIDLPNGESISEFMKRIGEGSRVIAVFSDKYLKSEYCMFELFELFRNSKLEHQRLRKVIYPLRIGLKNLNSPQKKAKYLRYWESREKDWNAFIEKMATKVDLETSKNYQGIKNIKMFLDSLLGFIADTKSENFTKTNLSIIKQDIISWLKNN